MINFIRNQKLFILFVFFSVIVLLHTYYKDEIIWKGANKEFYIQYYYLSLIFFFIAIILLFLNKNFKIIFAIFLASTFFSIYLFEFYVTYIKTKVKVEDNRFNFFQNFKKNNSNATVMIPAKSYLDIENINFFPISGLSNKKTVFCNENGYMSIYDSDRYGFNNPDKEWDYNEIEYFVIGDSFGHGACVNRPNDIASKLRTYSDKPTLNVSFSGNGPLTEYASLIEYTKDKTIKNIIWLFYEGNDYYNLADELKNQVLLKYLEDDNFSQNLKLLQSKTDLFGEEIILAEENRYQKLKYREFKSFLKLNNLRKLFHKKQIVFYEKEMPKNDFVKVLKKISNKAKNLNANLIFVYLPAYKSFEVNASNEDIYLETLSAVQNENIKIIDIRNYFMNNDPYSYFPFRKNGHYTIEGYDKIAKLIFNLRLTNNE